MAVGLLGCKVGMTQVYDSAGAEVPVTVIQVGPCPVLQVRTVKVDGYDAVQLGFGAKPRRLCSRSESGHVAGLLPGFVKASVLGDGDGSFRFIREFRLEAGDVSPTAGDVLTVATFAELKHIDVTGVSKGRGFAGVMKRHNFGGVCASHGVKKVHRSGGSTGQSTDPGKVFKGTKMPGRYGGKQATVRRQKIVVADAERNLLLVRGAVPGFSGGYVTVRPTNCF
jgi:large subunit ribosomal protein L3